jgi:hypothetical protein
MPSNHGIYRQRIANPPPEYRHTAEDVGIFRQGIRQIFAALKSGAFTKTPPEQTKAVRLEFHFRQISERLVFSLQHLNALLQEMAAEFSSESLSTRMPAIGLQAGCQADHILTYLNTLIDDVACAIVLATGFPSPNPQKPIDSMGGLKGSATNAALAPVSSLLAELDNAGSWWELAFKPKVGGRQLLIHNQYFVTFQGTKSDGQPFEAQAFVMTPFAQTPCPHFLSLLRAIFAGLFDWLDRLEVAMTTYLRTKSSTWSPQPGCPFFMLPVGYPPGTTTFHQDYFALPLCNGSDPLPWTTTVSSG